LTGRKSRAGDSAVLNLQHRSWDIDLPRDAPTIGGKQGHAKVCAGQALLKGKGVR